MRKPAGKLAAGGRDLSEVAFLFLLSRVLIVLVGFIAIGTLVHGPYLPDWSYSGNPVQDVIRMGVRFDSGWYLTIVRDGYSYDPAKVSNIVFFPLYPLAVSLFGYVGLPDEVAGLLISNLCALGFSLMLFKLLSLDFSPSDSKRAALYVLIFPVSFFFSAVYAESLFLFLTVSSFYFARKSNWLAAGVLGGLAALTRGPGFLIFLPLAFEYLEQKRFDLRQVRPNALALLLVPLGTLLFMAYCQAQFGDALAFSHNIVVWNGPHALGLKSLDLFSTFFRQSPKEAPFPMNYVYLSTALSAIAISFASFKFLRKSYAIYAVLLVFTAFSLGRLDAAMRYMAVIFPLFATLAILGRNRTVDIAITAAFLVLLSLFTAMIAAGYKMF